MFLLSKVMHFHLPENWVCQILMDSSTDGCLVQMKAGKKADRKHWGFLRASMLANQKYWDALRAVSLVCQRRWGSLRVDLTAETRAEKLASQTC